MAARTYHLGGNNGTVIANGIVAALYMTAAGATAAGVEVLRIWLSQSGTTTSQQLGVQVGSKANATGTLVSATPVSINASDPAPKITGGTTGAAGTSGIFATVNGAGAETIFWSDSFNNLNGYLWTPTREETLIMMPGTGTGIIVKLFGTPTTLTGWTVDVEYREIG